MPITSSTDLCNMALRHVAVSQELQDVTSDKTKAAQACRRFYDQVIGEVLRAFPWPFATATVNLTLVASDPTTEWLYSYRYPSDCLFARRILNGVSRIEQPDTRIRFRLQRDASGRLIFTDQPAAQLEYTQRVSAVEEFDENFITAAAFLLAFYIGPSVMEGDPSNLTARASQAYMAAIRTAQALAANEDVPDLPPDSAFITSRD